MTETRNKESTLWSWLKKGALALSNDGNPCHIHRVEDSTKSGTPDVEGCIGSKSFWIELKVATEVKTKKSIRIKTTAFQIYFAIKRHRAGGSSLYLIRVGTDKNTKHYLIPGYKLEENCNDLIPIYWLEENSICLPNSEAKKVLICAAIGQT